jgi:CHAT domain-containing protein
VLFLLTLQAAAGEASPFSRCDRQLATQPQARAAARCFWEVGREKGLAQEAIRRLEVHLARSPDSPWLHFYLGNLRWSEPVRAAAEYATAAEQLAARREALGEVLARGNLYEMLYEQGRLDEAGGEAERAGAAAEASGDAEAVARAKVLVSRHLYRTGGDLARADLLLRQAQPTLFPGGSYDARRDWLWINAEVAFQLGRLREAAAAFGRLLELTIAGADLYAEAYARHGLARVAFEEAMELPGEARVEEARARARSALAVAIVAGHRNVHAESEQMLGLLTPGDEALQHAERCLAAAPTDRDRSFCLQVLAGHLSASDPRAAQAALDRAFAFARSAADPWALIHCWRGRMRLAWVSAAPEQAFAEGLAALQVIEALREAQRSQSGRAEVFATWVADYHWLSGRLLAARAAGGDRRLLDHAFAVTERMRARTLLEAVAGADAARASTPAATALRKQRATVLEEIARVQRRLLDPAAPEPARTGARRELERLELAAAGLRDRLADAAPAPTALRGRDFATLAAVQRALAPDEALLSFQVAPWRDAGGRFAGGAWLLAVTHDAVRAYQLEGRVELRDAVALFEGMIPRRTSGETRAAAALYRRLLAPALAGLPSRIDRLILVPDDDLHRLPFAALRATPDGPPLAARYQLSEVPSATLWLRWRAARDTAPRPALALADPPSLGYTTAAAAPRGAPAERAAVFAAVVRLPPLPYARREGRAVVRNLGAGSELRLGAGASEAYLKRSGHRFGLLHLATHAVIDDELAERSAVYLAPGAATEDGLLQAREIADLDLRGTAVVLASCQSASGTLLRGEGVVGLARAFFQAGARAVVASLWKIRDDDAATFFASFYRQLGDGRSLAAALQAAQAERFRAGAPAAAWAGFVVLGDGGYAPAPPRRWRPAAAAALVALALALAAAALLAARQRAKEARGGREGGVG